MTQLLLISQGSARTYEAFLEVIFFCWTNCSWLCDGEALDTVRAKIITGHSQAPADSNSSRKEAREVDLGP